MSDRPSIPAEIQREILLESGHRCAVCGAPTPLERAHIIPWRKSKEHKAEDLICLNADCHERADKENWGEKMLREYKKRPWVMRQYEHVDLVPKQTTKLEITLKMELEDFDERIRAWLQFAIAAFLNIPPDVVRIGTVEKSNSVKVAIELPKDAAQEILTAYETDDSEISRYFAPLVLIGIHRGVAGNRLSTVLDLFHGFLARFSGSWPVRVAVLILASMLLIVLFAFRPVRLQSGLLKYDVATAKPLDGTARELIRLELQKANDEIKLRIEQEDTWFHYKFLLVGVLLAAFLGYLGFGDGRLFGESNRGTPQKERSPKERLDEILDSRATCSVLVMALVVALTIDMHVRNNAIVIQQLALWIANQVEPAFLQTAFSSQATGAFLPWEQFLRVEFPAAGMHRDDLYGFAFYPHLHFLTWVLYMFYLGSFQKLSLAHGRLLKPNESARLQQPWITIAGFVLVHLSFAAFAWIGHYVPGALELKILPWRESWKSGSNAAIYYLIPWALLVILNVPYLILLFFQEHERKKQELTS